MIMMGKMLILQVSSLIMPCVVNFICYNSCFLVLFILIYKCVLANCFAFCMSEKLQPILYTGRGTVQCLALQEILNYMAFIPRLVTAVMFLENDNCF